MDAGYQHTTPLLISGSIADGSISKLQRVRFEKSGDLAQVYDENWVQNLVQLHPELLPVRRGGTCLQRGDFCYALNCRPPAAISTISL